MNISKVLELLAIIKNNWGLSDIEFIPDSGEGCDENKLMITVPQVGVIYFYPQNIYLFRLNYPTCDKLQHGCRIFISTNG